MASSSAVGIAFALVCMAGLCAPLGAACVVFLRRGHSSILAAALALAAGVMIFVSLTEVLSESVSEIHQRGFSEPLVLLLAYSSLIAGIAVCWLLDVATELILRYIIKAPAAALAHPSVHLPRASSETARRDKVLMPPPTPKQQQQQFAGEDGHFASDLAAAEAAVTVEAGGAAAADEYSPLLRTTVLVILALTAHNLPEGLATFVGYMASPQLGFTIALAIAIHNIPEGVAIGVPVFFATGSRWRAIAWAGVSGVAEPLGAVIGLAVYKSGHLDPLAMGIIMGITAGIMTGVAIRELIPRSLQYDASGKSTFRGVVAGIVIMAVSLVLLSLV